MAPSRLIPGLLFAAATFAAATLRATGGYDDEPPPTLPYYLTRLPAKPPALIFAETFSGPREPDGRNVDYKAGLLALAGDCEAGQPPAALLASTDKLLTRARYAEDDAASLCNVLGDVRDLFAATPPVTGKTAARYLRCRVDHAAWFNLPFGADPTTVSATQQAKEAALDGLAADPQEKTSRAHWLYLRGAVSQSRERSKAFWQVVEEFPDDPRAESARFMLARCALVASRVHETQDRSSATLDETEAVAKDRQTARTLFEDEWRHAFDWWQKAADAAPKDSPIRAWALWAA